MMFIRIDRYLGEFMRLLPRVCGMRSQTTNTSILKLFWMISMMIFEVYEIIEVV